MAIVGIACTSDESGYRIPRTYVHAVEMAGGVPLLIPPMPAEKLDTAMQCVDGLLLAGGPDVDPVHYGALTHPKLGMIDPPRDEMELHLARTALRMDLPMMAICRGHQVVAVAAGGTLVQDLGSEWQNAILHAQRAPRDYGTHTVAVTDASLLRRIVGQETIRVNTFHHQAVRELPTGFRVTGRAPDGVIEAYEKEGARFLLSVQWHPEGMVDADETSRKLFAAFVEACTQNAR